MLQFVLQVTSLAKDHPVVNGISELKEKSKANNLDSFQCVPHPAGHSQTVWARTSVLRSSN